MKLGLWAIGKIKSSHLERGIQEYQKRTSRYQSLELVDIVVKQKSNQPALVKKIEAEKILAKVPAQAHLVLLDEIGKKMDSMAFSSFIQDQMLASTQHLIFLIGGPFGFDESVYQRANDKISLSSMTFPHDLAKFILAEQIYRAYTILNNTPYHHQ